MLEIIITKIILGITLAAPIGPVNAEMLRRGLIGGFWGAFSVRLGGSIANSICLIIAYFGLGQLKQGSDAWLVISCIGEVVLIYMGINTITKCTSKDFMPSIPENVSLSSLKKSNDVQNYSIKSGILIGLTLAFTSPIGMMFWLGTFSASMQQEANKCLTLDLTNLLINFFIIVGVLIWGIFVSLVLHFGGKIVDKKKLRIISFISGLILIYFGIKYGIKTFKNF